MATVRRHRCGLFGGSPVFARCAHDTDRSVDAEVVGVAAQVEQLLVGDPQFVTEFTQPHRRAPQPPFDEP